MKLFDSMGYPEYGMILKLDPRDGSVAGIEVWAGTSLVEIVAAWVSASWNIITIKIPHIIPGELLMMVLRRLNSPLRM